MPLRFGNVARGLVDEALQDRLDFLVDVAIVRQ
jgi:hypothetical protein